ncbi:MAG TPA: hypothetical protein VLZ84_06150 [Asticcacaulis sp.]|nr:hypothetical protein [Asticcacaulis sp.]
MIDDHRQPKNMPLSDGFISAFTSNTMPSWLSYVFIGIVGLGFICYMPELWRGLQTGKIILGDWLSQHWIWPILCLNFLPTKSWHRPTYFFGLLAYIVTILLLEFRSGTLDLSKPAELSFMYWMQIIGLIAMLVLASFSFVASRKSK